MRRFRIVAKFLSIVINVIKYNSDLLYLYFSNFFKAIIDNYQFLNARTVFGLFCSSYNRRYFESTLFEFI